MNEQSKLQGLPVEPKVSNFVVQWWHGVQGWWDHWGKEHSIVVLALECT